MQTIINPLVVSVGPTNEATITPVPMTAHGGGAKKVLAVVAAVAIPIAAPAIASSIAASSVLGATISAAMTTTAGAVVSSAIVGAGLGAITAKVTGGNVKAGAISGLIGGGIGGYGSASKGLFGTPQGGVQGTVNRTFGTSFGQAAHYQMQQWSNVILVNRRTSYKHSYTDPNVSNAIVTDSSVALSNDAASGSFLDSMKKGVGAATEKIADRLTNPDTLANAVLQVGGAVAAEAIVGTPGITPEEQAALETYKAELEVLKQRDEAAFNAKMDAAKQYMVQAGYYDPQYFGLQSANQAAIAEGRKLREFERKAGLRTGGVSAGDRRRAALSGGRNVQSAFDRGFLQGINLQNQAMSTGVGLIPSAPTSGTTGAYNMAVLAQNQGNAERAAADRKKSNIQKFFGGFSTQSGLTKDEQEERKKKSSRGLDTGNIPNLDQKNYDGSKKDQILEA